jgi:hypothetical protein
VREISDDERIQLIQSEDFMKFFTKNTRILERALEQGKLIIIHLFIEFLKFKL